jgi:peptidoglycan LD-endopeptidase LytH
MFALVVLAFPARAVAADDVRAAQQRANRAAAELNRATSSLAVAENELASLEERQSEARSRSTKLRGVVEALALSQYVHGGTNPLALDTVDLNRWARGRALLRLASLSTEDALERSRAAREELADLRGGLTRTLSSRRAALASLRTEQRQAVAELERLAKTQREAEAEAKARGAGKAPAGRGTAAGRATAIAAKGPWMCPVQGTHSFSNDYGAPRGGGASHKGNDILAPRGTPVAANVAGSVDQHPNRLGGLAYYLHGNDGKTYYGAHLDSFGASGSVAMGTVIGYVGNTGDASGGPTHLHFEIIEGGVSVNPYATLVRYC